MSTTETQAVPAGTWALDPVHSTIGFAVGYMAGTFTAGFGDFDAVVTDGVLTGSPGRTPSDLEDEDGSDSGERSSPATRQLGLPRPFRLPDALSRQAGRPARVRHRVLAARRRMASAASDPRVVRALYGPGRSRTCDLGIKSPRETNAAAGSVMQIAEAVRVQRCNVMQLAATGGDKPVRQSVLPVPATRRTHRYQRSQKHQSVGSLTEGVDLFAAQEEGTPSSCRGVATA